MSDVSPLCGISGLLFASTLQSSLLFFCLVISLFLFYHFSACWPILLTFSPRKFFHIFRCEIGSFVWLLFISYEKLVDQRYVQHAAIWYWYLLLCIYIIF